LYGHGPSKGVRYIAAVLIVTLLQSSGSISAHPLTVTQYFLGSYKSTLGVMHVSATGWSSGIIIIWCKMSANAIRQWIGAVSITSCLKSGEV